MTTRHPLAELIDSVKAANGWSDPQLVANARAKGYVLSKSNISRYRQPVVSIKGDVIQALAAGLRVSPAQVAVAAMQSMGIQLPPYESTTPEQAIKLDISLSVRDKGALLALLARMRAEEKPSPVSSGQLMHDSEPSSAEVLWAAVERAKFQIDDRNQRDQQA